jgi:hypothetical protein
MLRKVRAFKVEEAKAFKFEVEKLSIQKLLITFCDRFCHNDIFSRKTTGNKT